MSIQIQGDSYTQIGFVRSVPSVFYRFHRRRIPLTRFSAIRFYRLPGKAFLPLPLCLLLGCAAGIWLSQGVREVFPQALDAFRRPAGFPAALVLPLLASGFAVYIRCPVLLYPLAFWKGLFFSYTAFGLLAVCGGGGWLVVGTAMFSSLCSLPVLWWYWMQCLRRPGFDLRCFGAALAGILVTGLADRWVISPFLVNILTF